MSVGSGQWITAGLAMRGQVRRALAREGIAFTEHKNLLDSTFVFDLPPDEWAVLQNWIHRMGGTLR